MRSPVRHIALLALLAACLETEPPLSEADCAAADAGVSGQILQGPTEEVVDGQLAVAGAARDHMTMLIFGLVLSVALMGAAATLIARFMAQHHWLAYLGLAIVTLVALSMIYEGAEEILLVLDNAEAI